MKKQRKNGFSLIELLIVVAIILIIAAIAIPNLLRSKMAANQASAVGSVRTTNTAANTYQALYSNGWPGQLSVLGPGTATTASCANAELIDSVLAGGTKSGYTFAITPGSSQVTSSTSTNSSCSSNFGYADGYMITAVPVTVGTTGQNAYCSDITGVIRLNPSGTKNGGSGAAGCETSDNPLQ